MAAKNDITGAKISTKTYSKVGRENHDLIFSKKEPSYWLEKYHSGLIILDIDGWDRKDPNDFNKPITYKEFMQKLSYCTCSGLYNK